ncbi:uncharacterized protein C8Q71DRAFT_547979 [Rhodofomes roseus]|uniref:F-box domain-containing protein n=1 Tax=Rhodofomes roseus TaxID=34475 RepID=A0ABQ8KHV4_9APHY|nr:uncharacterized protein C8Q71DRAFT_547979 [Rhodofomes roseus]KAH9837546.1 hypothetical protein C8Q71DRAFT_547979 [Rhodofomes roseus]
MMNNYSAESPTMNMDLVVGTTDAGILLPMEIWEHVIDLIAEKVERQWNLLKCPWWLTLISCALTCKALYNRARWHLRGNVMLLTQSNVVSFARLLRAEPYLRPVMRFVTIAGSPSRRHLPIPHIGTFAIMLARCLPRMQALVITNANWTIGSIRQQDIVNLAAFRCINELTLQDIRFATVSQLGQLISSVPQLQILRCARIKCNQKVSPLVLPPLPLNSTRLRIGHLEDTMSPAIHDFLYRILTSANLLRLSVGAHHRDISSSLIKLQRLLDACAWCLRDLRLTLNMKGVVDQSPEKLCEHINLSRFRRLRSLRFSTWCYVDSDYSWIPHLLYTVVTFIVDLKIIFHVSVTNWEERLSALLHRLETGNELAELDTFLATPRIDIRPGNPLVQVLLALEGSGSTYNPCKSRISDDEWSKLVRGKMPHADECGILRTIIY